MSDEFSLISFIPESDVFNASASNIGESSGRTTHPPVPHPVFIKNKILFDPQSMVISMNRIAFILQQNTLMPSFIAFSA